METLLEKCDYWYGWQFRNGLHLKVKAIKKGRKQKSKKKRRIENHPSIPKPINFTWPTPLDVTKVNEFLKLKAIKK